MGLSAVTGRDAIVRHAQVFAGEISDTTRTGDLVSTGDGQYTVRIEFVASGAPWTGEIEVERELLPGIEFLMVETAISP